MGEDIRKNRKRERVTEFVNKMKKVYKEAGAALKKAQEDIKKQANKERKKTEKQGQNNVEYKELNVQGKTSKEVSKPICRFLYNQGGGIHQCGQTMTANLNENPSSCKYQSDSTVQGASRGVEKKER